MPDVGSGIGDSLRVIQANPFRPERPDSSFRSPTSRLFHGCPLPPSTFQRVAPVERFVGQLTLALEIQNSLKDRLNMVILFIRVWIFP